MFESLEVIIMFWLKYHKSKCIFHSNLLIWQILIIEIGNKHITPTVMRNADYVAGVLWNFFQLQRIMYFDFSRTYIRSISNQLKKIYIKKRILFKGTCYYNSFKNPNDSCSWNRLYNFQEGILTKANFFSFISYYMK